jgi:hypothetical protein
MTLQYVMAEVLVYLQIYVPIVKEAMVDPNASSQSVMDSYPMILQMYVLHKGPVDHQTIVHVSTPTFGEISANSMNFIGKVKVEIGPLLEIGSSILMVHW